MTGIVSRVVVGVVGLPVVLALAWGGGWWLFGLLAFAAVVAVHEFVTVARPLRPLGPAAYLGVALALSGARVGGLVWLVGGFLATFALAFLFNAIAETRAPSTVAIGATVLCAAWIGLGLGHIQLLRGMHTEPRLLAFTVLLTVWAADTFAYFGGRLIGRHKMAPTLSPGKTWEGFVIGSLPRIFVALLAPYSDRDHHPVIWGGIVLGAGVVIAGAPGGPF